MSDSVTDIIKEVLIDVLPIIEKVAPYLAAYLKGNNSFVIGFLIPLLANAFNTQSHDLESLTKSIMTDPNAEDKLKNIEEKYCAWITHMCDIAKK